VLLRGVGEGLGVDSLKFLKWKIEKKIFYNEENFQRKCCVENCLWKFEFTNFLDSSFLGMKPCLG
jgi:hypothetical protein